MLAVHKANVSANWAELKEELKPVNNVFSFLGKLTTRDKTNPLVNIGIDVAGDLLLRKMLLAKAGWAIRFVVPFLLKNYSSNVFTEKAKPFIQGVRNWLKGDNGQPEPVDNSQY